MGTQLQACSWQYGPRHPAEQLGRRLFRHQSGMCEYGHRHGGVDSMSVAMQYVPWQHWSRIYSPEEGLQCGTIFPELNKPFYGKGVCR